MIPPNGGVRGWLRRARLLNRGFTRPDFRHPFFGVLRPGADDLHVFGAVCLHKICAGNHRLRIESAHHWIIDCRTSDHVNCRFGLTIRV